jgi:hypothetical protein
MSLRAKNHHAGLFPALTDGNHQIHPGTKKRPNQSHSESFDISHPRGYQPTVDPRERTGTQLAMTAVLVGIAVDHVPSGNV